MPDAVHVWVPVVLISSTARHIPGCTQVLVASAQAQFYPRGQEVVESLAELNQTK